MNNINKKAGRFCVTLVITFFLMQSNTLFAQEKEIVPNLKKVVISPKAGIKGQIRNTGDSLLANVQITVRKDGEIIAQTTSDSTGYYRLIPLKVDVYELEYALPNYLTKILIKTEIIPGQEWYLPVILYKKRNKAIATHETSMAPRNLKYQTGYCGHTITTYREELVTPHWHQNALNILNVNIIR